MTQILSVDVETSCSFPAESDHGGLFNMTWLHENLHNPEPAVADTSR